jgi:hypothetical protein
MCANFYFAEMAPDGRCPAATLRISFLIQASAIVSQSSKFCAPAGAPKARYLTTHNPLTRLHSYCYPEIDMCNPIMNGIFALRSL